MKELIFIFVVLSDFFFVNYKNIYVGTKYNSNGTRYYYELVLFFQGIYFKKKLPISLFHLLIWSEVNLEYGLGRPITSLALRRNFRGEPFDGLLEGLVGALEEVPKLQILLFLNIQVNNSIQYNRKANPSYVF